MKIKYISPVLSTDNISCMGGVVCTSFRTCEIFIYTLSFCQDIFFGFGSSEANLIPSLASCIEKLFLFLQLVLYAQRSQEVCSLCPNYKEGSSREPPLHQQEELFNTLFEYAVDATSKYWHCKQAQHRVMITLPIRPPMSGVFVKLWQISRP